MSARKDRAWPAAAIAACVLSPAVLAAGETTVRIAFTPAPGSVHAKTWTIEHDVTLAELKRGVGDLLQPVNLRMQLETFQRVEVVDEYLRVGEGRPLELRRSFAKVRRYTEERFPAAPGLAEDRPLRYREKSPLRGVSVRFTWVPERETYGKLYDGEEAEEMVLADLREDMDLRVLLPASEVVPGDTWRVAASDLVDLVAAGGGIPFDEPENKEDALILRSLRLGVAGSLDRIFGGVQEGGADVTFAGLREEAGTRLADLDVALELELAHDRTGFSRESLMKVERQEGIDFEDVHVEYHLSGTGRLVWDLDAGRAARFDFEGSETIFARVRETRSGEDQRSTQELKLHGRFGIRVEPSDAAPLPLPGPEGLPEGTSLAAPGDDGDDEE